MRAIVVLCSKEDCPIYLLKSGKQTIYAHIPDPFDQSIEQMREIRGMIKAMVLLAMKEID